MAKTPVAVTAAEWKKAKPVTLKDPGLDKKLAAWEAAQKALKATPTIKNVQKSADALAEVVAMAKTTAAGANKTLHKDGIAFLAGYPAAAAKFAATLQKQGADLSLRAQTWKKGRIDTLAALKARLPAADKLVKKAEATLKQYEETDHADAATEKRSMGLCNSMFDEVSAFRQETVDVVNRMRVAGNKHGSPHQDDRNSPQMDKVFTDTAQASSDIEVPLTSVHRQLGRITGKNVPNYQPGS